MEGYPFRVVRQDETGCDHQFREVVRIDTHVFVSLEIDPMVAQKVDGLRRVHVFSGSKSAKQSLVMGERSGALYVKVEVELPCADILGKVSFLIREGQPDLDRLEQVDVAPHRLVMVVRRGLERPDWSGNDARKFRILLHADTRVLATRAMQDKVLVGVVKCTIAT